MDLSSCLNSLIKKKESGVDLDNQDLMQLPPTKIKKKMMGDVGRPGSQQHRSASLIAGVIDLSQGSSIVPRVASIQAWPKHRRAPNSRENG